MNSKSFIPFLVLFCLVFNSCSIIKTNRLVKKSKLQNEVFYVEIPFTYNSNQIFVPVEIEGKPYNFIFDTGADLSIIDQEILKSISYEKQFSRNVFDASNSKSKLDFISIPKIAISELEFTNIIAVSADLKHFEKRISCPRIDGVIGIDLIRKSNWKIDYKNNLLCATNSFNKIKNTEQPTAALLKTGKNGAIITKLESGDKKINMKLDTGFSGGLLIDKHKSQLAYNNYPNNQKTFTIAETGTTLNEKKMTKSRVDFIKLDQIKLQNSILTNQIVTLSNHKNLIGNSFLENYQVLMNFSNDEIILKGAPKEIEMIKENFEIILAPNYKNTRIEIIGFMDGANNLDLFKSEKLEIISINNKDVTKFSKDELCEYWLNDSNPYFRENEISLKVKNGEIFSEIKLARKTYL